MTDSDKISGPRLYLILWKAFRAIEAIDNGSIRRQGFACLSDFGLLDVLANRGSLPVNAIRERVLLTSGSMTAAVDRAEKQGWVRREPSTVDRRVTLVHLTEEGRTHYETAFAIHTDNLDKAFSSLSSEERSILATLLKKAGKHAANLAAQS